MLNKTPKPAILQILPDLNIGGVQRTTVNTANLLVKNGYQAYVASHSGVLSKMLDKKVHTLKGRFHSKNPFWILLNVFILIKWIKRYQIYIVHARSRAPAWSAWLACKLTQATFVTTVHAPYGTQNFFKKCYNAVMFWGKHIAFVSKYVYDEMKIIYGEIASHEIIYPIINLAQFAPNMCKLNRLKAYRKKWGITKNDFVIVTTSRVTKSKGILDIIDALSHLKLKKSVKYIAVGPLDKNSSFHNVLKDRINTNGLDKKVILAGQLPSLCDVYALADCFISASHKEAFGRVIIEAMASETLAIVSNVGAVEEIVKDQETGFIFPAKNSKALANVIEKVVHLETQKRKQIIDNATQYINQHFSEKMINLKILDFYYKIINNKR